MSSPDTTPKTSFSRGRRWAIGFNVLLAIVIVFGVVVMVNYLSTRYFTRFYLSTRTKIQLSPRTVSLVRSLTNDVTVTIYYDQDSNLYGFVTSLLKEYSSLNPKIRIQSVDYLRDVGPAQPIKTKYNLSAINDKDLVIFDGGEGRVKIVDGSMLAANQDNFVRGTNDQVNINRKLVAFNGEIFFSAALLAVSSTQQLQALFLQGHGERSPDNVDDPEAFQKLAQILKLNYIKPNTLTLSGTNGIPVDCNLLIIAGPRTPFPDSELDKIEQYLNQGGRMLLMFDAYSVNRVTGLEAILARWGVEVSPSIIRDPNNSADTTRPVSQRQDIIVSILSRHRVTDGLSGSALHVILPRRISKMELPGQPPAEVPEVTELAFSSPESTLTDSPLAKPASHPLIVAVVKGAVKGVASERGTTRVIVTGDSLFLGNHQIESGGNRDFANAAVNWLLDRTVLLEGIGPQPVTEYRLAMTSKQMKTAQWIILGAMPGGILLLGGLVWLRRRR